MEFEELYLNIMKIDPDIRYVAIQNDRGEKICGDFRESIDPMLNEEELKMMHYYASQRWQTRKNIEHKIGNNRYAMAEYDKLKRITVPLDKKHLLILTTEIKTDHTKVIDKILEIILANSKEE